MIGSISAGVFEDFICPLGNWGTVSRV